MIRTVTELNAGLIDLPQDDHPPLALCIAVQRHLVYAAARLARSRPYATGLTTRIAPKPHGQEPQRDRRVRIVLRMKLVKDPKPMTQRRVRPRQAP